MNNEGAKAQRVLTTDPAMRDGFLPQKCTKGAGRQNGLEQEAAEEAEGCMD
jgi:hypothetical protein